MISFISLLLLYWPLIDLRFYFLDDVGRALEGYSGDYTSAGRPLTAALIKLLTLGLPLTDIAPAPQLIAVLSLALTAALLADLFEITSPVSLVVFSVAVGGSPYFLENMSFRFDSAFMALGVLCSVAPFWLGTASISALAGSSALLFASFCLYQQTTNCYLVIALCVTAHSLLTKSLRDTLLTGLRFAVQFALAVAVYWTLWKVLSRHAKYLGQHGGLVTADSAFNAALAHLHAYVERVFAHWTSTSLGMIWATMALVAGTVFLAHIIISHRGTIAAKVMAAALGIALLLLTFPAALFSLLFLTEPQFDSRDLVGFVALIASFSGLLLLWTRDWRMGFLARGLVLLQVIGLVGLNYTYVNALRMQERYDDRITGAIVHDIMEMEPTGEELRTFVISGWIGRPAMVEHSVAKYPAISSSVFSVLYQDSYWAAARFKTFGLGVKPAPPGAIDEHDLICRGTPSKNNAQYALYLVDHTVFIRFKNDGVKCGQ